MALSLAGKTAIVTGAGSGLNLSFARVLLSKQCNVVFADLALRPEAQELVSGHQNASRSPAKAVFQKTDVRDWQQLGEMFSVADKEFGGADIVCPGAGVYEPPWSNFWHPPSTPPSRDSPSSSRFALLDINLTHPIRTTQLAISHFLTPTKHTSSSFSPPKPPVSPLFPRHIIHISSIAAQTTPLPAAMYNATKHGLSGFVRSLSLLDRMGVRVTAVAPGLVKTPLWTDHPEKLHWIGKADEWVTPEFVAEKMVDLIEKEELEVEVDNKGGEGRKMVKMEGGLILEVAKGRVRKVEQYNDPGPAGEGTTVEGMETAEEEVLGRLKEGWGM
ncbi:hypothetical protein MMC08_005047 [Hypocenomyce scalaris]|nr:hypothetical protein [Hypocenomyce scalaris]